MGFDSDNRIPIFRLIEITQRKSTRCRFKFQSENRIPSRESSIAHISKFVLPLGPSKFAPGNPGAPDLPIGPGVPSGPKDPGGPGSP